MQNILMDFFRNDDQERLNNDTLSLIWYIRQKHIQLNIEEYIEFDLK